MKKKNVLELEYEKVFDMVAIRVKYQNCDILKRGKFEDENLRVRSINVPDYSSGSGILSIQGEVKREDDRIILVSEYDANKIKQQVKELNKRYGELNKRYGIEERWRAERGRDYYYIDSECTAFGTYDYRCNEDNIRYELGNYFRTEEDAEKALEKIKQIFNELK